jgi:uncharacterized membrane protein YbaN (DUF454 family)
MRNAETKFFLFYTMSQKFIKALLIIAGTISTAVGIAGIFIPILPTTPFLLLAAACYLRSSPRLYRWLLENRLCGGYIKNYIEGRGMPLRVKTVTILLLWITIGISIFVTVENIVIPIMLVIIASGVTVHIISIKDRKPAKTEADKPCH